MAEAGGHHQRREARLGRQLRVRALVDQCPGHGQVAFRQRPEQRGLSRNRFSGIHLRTLVQQRRDRRHAPCAGGCHQGCFTGGQGQVRVGAGLEEQVQHGGAAVQGGKHRVAQQLAEVVDVLAQQRCQGQIHRQLLRACAMRA